MSRQNVREQVTLTDTVLVGKWVGQMSDRPQGWYATFAEMGAAGDLNFFNIRNRSVGIAYNNQDARDQLPYGIRVQSLGLRFWAATASTFTSCLNIGEAEIPREAWAEDEYTEPPFATLTNREELHAGVWEADIPNHCAAELRTNQDVRLKIPVAMLPPGTGPVGGGWGWGSPGDLIYYAQGGSPVPAISGESAPPYLGAFAGNLQHVEHGKVDIRFRFPFPIPLDIPKRANLNLTLKLSQYAREMLQRMWGPYWWPQPGDYSHDGPVTKVVKSALYGIECTMRGERLVQQRGDYSV